MGTAPSAAAVDTEMREQEVASLSRDDVIMTTRDDSSSFCSDGSARLRLRDAEKPAKDQDDETVSRLREQVRLCLQTMNDNYVDMRTPQELGHVVLELAARVVLRKKEVETMSVEETVESIMLQSVTWTCMAAIAHQKRLEKEDSGEGGAAKALKGGAGGASLLGATEAYANVVIARLKESGQTLPRASSGMQQTLRNLTQLRAVYERDGVDVPLLMVPALSAAVSSLYVRIHEVEQTILGARGDVDASVSMSEQRLINELVAWNRAHDARLKEFEGNLSAITRAVGVNASAVLTCRNGRWVWVWKALGFLETLLDLLGVLVQGSVAGFNRAGVLLQGSWDLLRSSTVLVPLTAMIRYFMRRRHGTRASVVASAAAAGTALMMIHDSQGTGGMPQYGKEHTWKPDGVMATKLGVGFVKQVPEQLFELLKDIGLRIPMWVVPWIQPALILAVAFSGNVYALLDFMVFSPLGHLKRMLFGTTTSSLHSSVSFPASAALSTIRAHVRYAQATLPSLPWTQLDCVPILEEGDRRAVLRGLPNCELGGRGADFYWGRAAQLSKVVANIARAHFLLSLLQNWLETFYPGEEEEEEEEEEEDVAMEPAAGATTAPHFMRQTKQLRAHLSECAGLSEKGRTGGIMTLAAAKRGIDSWTASVLKLQGLFTDADLRSNESKQTKIGLFVIASVCAATWAQAFTDPTHYTPFQELKPFTGLVLSEPSMDAVTGKKRESVVEVLPSTKRARRGAASGGASADTSIDTTLATTVLLLDHPFKYGLSGGDGDGDGPQPAARKSTHNPQPAEERKFHLHPAEERKFHLQDVLRELYGTVRAGTVDAAIMNILCTLYEREHARGSNTLAVPLATLLTAMFSVYEEKIFFSIHSPVSEDALSAQQSVIIVPHMDTLIADPSPRLPLPPPPLDAAKIQALFELYNRVPAAVCRDNGTSVALRYECVVSFVRHKFKVDFEARVRQLKEQTRTDDGNVINTELGEVCTLLLNTLHDQAQFSSEACANGMVYPSSRQGQLIALLCDTLETLQALHGSTVRLLKLMKGAGPQVSSTDHVAVPIIPESECGKYVIPAQCVEEGGKGPEACVWDSKWYNACVPSAVQKDMGTRWWTKNGPLAQAYVDKHGLKRQNEVGVAHSLLLDLHTESARSLHMALKDILTGTSDGSGVTLADAYRAISFADTVVALANFFDDGLLNQLIETLKKELQVERDKKKGVFTLESVKNKAKWFMTSAVQVAACFQLPFIGTIATESAKIMIADSGMKAFHYFCAASALQGNIFWGAAQAAISAGFWGLVGSSLGQLVLWKAGSYMVMKALTYLAIRYSPDGNIPELQPEAHRFHLQDKLAEHTENIVSDLKLLLEDAESRNKGLEDEETVVGVRSVYWMANREDASGKVAYGMTLRPMEVKRAFDMKDGPRPPRRTRSYTQRSELSFNTVFGLWEPFLHFPHDAC